MTKNVLIDKPLAGFAEADTRSPREGTVEPGVYPLLQLLEHRPDKDTDYARIAIPNMSGGETWVCSRWKLNKYAAVTGGRPDFSDDALAIPESAITSLLPAFHRYQYSLKDARYPRPLPGVRLLMAPPERNNCCTFVEALVVGAWVDTHAIAWSVRQHNQMMITSTADPFSPVTAAIEAEMALAVADADSPPGPWTLIQGWQKPKSDRELRGHTFLVVDYDPDTDRVLTLESNLAFGLDGPGWRSLGRLSAQPLPPADWRQRQEAPTWAGLKKLYASRRQALLRVHSRSLSGMG